MSSDKELIVALYVDDLLIFSKNNERIKKLKAYLLSKFKVRDIGQTTLILSLSINRDRKNRTITLDQEHYIRNLMKKYDLKNADFGGSCAPSSSPESLMPKDPKSPEAEANINEYQTLLGELNWLVRGTRPQNCFTTNRLAQIAYSPAVRHMVAAMYLLKYSCNTMTQGWFIQVTYLAI